MRAVLRSLGTSETAREVMNLDSGCVNVVYLLWFWAIRLEAKSKESGAQEKWLKDWEDSLKQRNDMVLEVREKTVIRIEILLKRK